MNGGKNTFLQKSDFHSNVREDFADGPNGVIKRLMKLDNNYKSLLVAL